MTAVEFMVKEISEILGPLKTEGMTDLLLLDAYKKAKAMEKEQNNAKIQKAIELFEEAKRQADISKDVIYLDGVLAVLDGIKNTNL